MHQITYISTVAKGTTEDDLRAILASSRRNNARVGITGLLLHDGKRFLQVLEGESAPLREALAQLELEGLVRIVPRRGIYIARKTKAEMLEMITVWAALESMAARLATEVASDEEIASLHELVDGFNGSDVGSHMFEYSDINIRFHQAIISLSRCKMIEEMANGLFVHVRAIRRRTIYERDRARRSVVDHKDIVEAIEARNGERAERLVREHTLKLREHVDRFVTLD